MSRAAFSWSLKSGLDLDDYNNPAAAAAAVLSPSKAGPRAAAAAAALAVERTRAAALEDKMRVAEAKSDAEHASQLRELEELRQQLHQVRHEQTTHLAQFNLANLPNLHN